MKPYQPDETGAQYIDRLEAEVISLNSEVDRLAIRVVPKLEADIERLEAALRDLLMAVGYDRASMIEEAAEKARAALEGK